MPSIHAVLTQLHQRATFRGWEDVTTLCEHLLLGPLHCMMLVTSHIEDARRIAEILCGGGDAAPGAGIAIECLSLHDALAQPGRLFRAERLVAGCLHTGQSSEIEIAAVRDFVLQRPTSTWAMIVDASDLPHVRARLPDQSPVFALSAMPGDPSYGAWLEHAPHADDHRACLTLGLKFALRLAEQAAEDTAAATADALVQQLALVRRALTDTARDVHNDIETSLLTRLPPLQQVLQSQLQQRSKPNPNNPATCQQITDAVISVGSRTWRETVANATRGALQTWSLTVSQHLLQIDWASLTVAAERTGTPAPQCQAVQLRLEQALQASITALMSIIDVDAQPGSDGVNAAAPGGGGNVGASRIDQRIYEMRSSIRAQITSSRLSLVTACRTQVAALHKLLGSADELTERLQQEATIDRRMIETWLGVVRDHRLG